ncbi:MAG TPA: acyltransferase [Alphaproteobacteria bacterium]|nr:acyltransferase [Alphaproteobacteria bacterium]
MATISAPARATGFATGVLSLRGLLALTVATAHTLGFTIPADYSASVFDQPNLLASIAKTIGTAINVPLLFFVISGLSIARSLDRKQDQGHGPRAYVTFIVRRALRLYPAYIVATVGVLGFAWMFLIGRPPLNPSRFPSMGYDFLADWLNGAVFNPLKARSVIANFAGLSWSMNLVIWSLYVEVCAVPLLPLFHGVARRKNIGADVLTLAALVLLSMSLWNVMAVRYLFAFYLGMLVQTRGRHWTRELVRRAGGASTAMAWAWSAVLSTCLLPTDLPACLLIQSVAAFAIISLLVWPGDEHPFGCLDRRWMHWNGRLSYSFYLWHYIILTVTMRTAYAADVAANLPQRLTLFAGIELLTFATALAVAQLSYSYVEGPFIRWGRRLDGWARPEAGRPPRTAFAARSASPPHNASPQGAD